MNLLVIILLILCLVLSFLLLSLRKNIRHIDQQLQQLEPETNQLITVDLNDSSINSLVQTINQKIMEQKNNQLALLHSEQELKETIANVSHDLRTPLTAIIGYTQLLEKGDPSSQQLAYIHTILEKNLYLKDLIHSFFELSYYESQNLAIATKQIDISALLIDEILKEAEAFETRGIQLELAIPEGIYLTTDEKMFTRILQNLLANVLAHGEKQLSIQLIQDNVTKLIVGNSYDPSIQLDPTRLFDRFYVSDTARGNKGNGLGLAIVKLLTEKLDGTVEANVTEDYFVIHLRFPR
ncbi:sensor histidine kinase [Enterococcus pallens]|uniref:histidine kinase n=1 Tax=Enterococcus pallens ATCC BAA-351 TaxID=1158607 RepID=R2T1Q5_9ENTE|nr:HAMP domain-containing sensor histidine kinase [Enterococcus pallens]EOH94214.1 hypothetical protein UAU_01949 [Enterococcus pallens ATCC BAA-351]EOU24093.1 hypothetical protein I588_00080 [Enterococcus pallens ATCC BAA-351]OJG82134.1 hypothetical protein RV10_GL001998 [Enterococcus pallens]